MPPSQCKSTLYTVHTPPHDLEYLISLIHENSGIEPFATLICRNIPQNHIEPGRVSSFRRLWCLFADCCCVAAVVFNTVATAAVGKISDCGRYCSTPAANPKDYQQVNGSVGTLSFSSFRQSFTTNVNYLKRRFSSGDLSSECDDGPITDTTVDPYTKGPPSQPVTSQPQAPPPPPPHGTGGSASAGDLSLNLRQGSKTTSAPSSPAKSRESLLQRVQSLTGQAKEQGASILGAAVSSATRVTSQMTRIRIGASTSVAER
ncbi:unnamed protein product [Callosobruchus maculatus]|uniref:Uncharacterized protein n=1 Tax=Callosobruchus maculatus TaxID=64391 RepID=A0A653CA37_CALMS|nr:unnamed protein product [Callosobruchus maculatus]